MPHQDAALSDPEGTVVFDSVMILSGKLRTPTTVVDLPTSGAAEHQLLSDDNIWNATALIEALLRLPGAAIGRHLVLADDGTGNPTPQWID